jgi:hypothetical protein
MRAITAIVLALLFAAEAAHADAPAFGVLPLNPEGLPGDALVILQADLERSLKEHAATSFLSSAEMLPHLAAVSALGLGCDRSDAKCMGDICALAGAPRIIYGRARGQAQQTGYAVELDLGVFDAVSRRRLTRVVTLLPPGEGRPDALKDAVARLLAPEDKSARLLLEVSEPGAEVIVDGLSWGTSPLDPAPVVVTPGRHEVVVKRAGYDGFASVPAVGVGEEVELLALLAPVDVEAEVPFVVASGARPVFGVLPWIALGAGTCCAGCTGVFSLFFALTAVGTATAGEEQLAWEERYRNTSDPHTSSESLTLAQGAASSIVVHNSAIGGLWTTLIVGGGLSAFGIATGSSMLFAETGE